METILDHILENPVLPVYYNDDPETCIRVVEACYLGGIRVFEFVNRGEKALQNFKILKTYAEEHLPELTLGIGTIKSAEWAKKFIDAGAQLIVSPIVKAEIAQVTLDKGILWIPGCMTPTEISLAEDLGAPLIKLFPGDSLGTGFLKSIKPLFPRLKFMPTGGVSPERDSIRRWFDAGVSAVGLGSKLFDKPANAENYDWLSERSRTCLLHASI
ncbi:2-dehydro-3-deoxyphosphogluconate aldolase / (4S)-4-hydroxy-2-oxoglutarate aldolase [bacterium A37T11]|nr:2-dehydro-3-deoxyphosphogluconate aldolase / (4S)-4-hydroxy-2-oxoglutarate aldolase [bacterium A37T11]